MSVNSVRLFESMFMTVPNTINHKYQRRNKKTLLCDQGAFFANNANLTVKIASKDV